MDRVDGEQAWRHPDQDDAELVGRKLVDAHEATWALWAVLRTADEAEHAVARDLGLPLTDALALDYVLSSVEPIGPAALARRLGVSSAAATVLVDRLVASGHLVRRPHPHDGRRRVLEATDHGLAEAISVLTPLLHAIDRVAARLDHETATAVTAYLREVARVHRQYVTARTRRR